MNNTKETMTIPEYVSYTLNLLLEKEIIANLDRDELSILIGKLSENLSVTSQELPGGSDLPIVDRLSGL